MNPAFSSTRADARLVADTSAEIRRSGKLSKQKSVTAVSASVITPRPQNCSLTSKRLSGCGDRHILSGMNTDAVDGCVVNLNTKFHFRLFADGSVQEFVRVLDRVPMREEIAHCQPHFAIIRMPRQRFGVIQPPRAKRASFEREPRPLCYLNLIPVFCTSR